MWAEKQWREFFSAVSPSRAGYAPLPLQRLVRIGHATPILLMQPLTFGEYYPIVEVACVQQARNINQGMN